MVDQKVKLEVEAVLKNNPRPASCCNYTLSKCPNCGKDLEEAIDKEGHKMTCFSCDFNYRVFTSEIKNNRFLGIIGRIDSVFLSTSVKRSYNNNGLKYEA